MKADILAILCDYYKGDELLRSYDIRLVYSTILIHKIIVNQTFGYHLVYRLIYNNIKVEIYIDCLLPYGNEIGEYCYKIKMGDKYTQRIIWDDKKICEYTISKWNISI